MPITHEYTIASLPRADLDGELEVISQIHVAITTRDGDHELTLQAFSYSIPEDQITPPFDSVADLDKDTILSWIPLDVRAEWEASMTINLQRVIDAANANQTNTVPAHLI